MRKTLRKQLEIFFPPDSDIVFDMKKICLYPDDEEAYENIEVFLNTCWHEVPCSAWSRHGAVNFMTPEGLVYYLPSLLVWAHEDFKSVALGFEAFLHLFCKNCKSGHAVMLILNPQVVDFLACYLGLIPDEIAIKYGLENEIEQAFLCLFAHELAS